MNRVIIPLDVSSVSGALALVDQLGDEADFYKIGFELYTRGGLEVVRELVSRDKRVFLDIKLHDIPNTVARAVEAASDLGVDLLTLHASGGQRMMEAAAEARSGHLKLLGVTVLTSMTTDEMASVWGRKISSVRDEALRLANLGKEAGLDGIVSSALEASWIRQKIGQSFLIVTPGIRPAGSNSDDQNRVATPREAVRSGADFLVIGRPITQADDPSAAFAAVLKEVEEA
ncbi:MAG: orotidine-5'-phosphate decarboxylase [Gemmatimonadetes bacterium]|nr:orotidine-5'-phosphate decarboxylase [Gemmatimonadota bacterium]MEE2863255.1 orotidine-5'-phosphate decarboxylase [Gemmatimonadota bacterium]